MPLNFRNMSIPLILELFIHEIWNLQKNTFKESSFSRKDLFLTITIIWRPIQTVIRYFLASNNFDLKNLRLKSYAIIRME